MIKIKTLTWLAEFQNMFLKMVKCSKTPHRKKFNRQSVDREVGPLDQTCGSKSFITATVFLSVLPFGKLTSRHSVCSCKLDSKNGALLYSRCNSGTIEEIYVTKAPTCSLSQYVRNCNDESTCRLNHRIKF